jgi:hypothetical protein
MSMRRLRRIRGSVVSAAVAGWIAWAIAGSEYLFLQHLMLMRHMSVYYESTNVE